MSFDINQVMGQLGNIAQLKEIKVTLGSGNRGTGLAGIASNVSGIVNSAQSGNIGGVISGVNNLANGLGSGTGGGGAGLTINRDGTITGSLAGGSITLAGGGIDWQGAVNQTNISPYVTRAQQHALAGLTKYIESMSDAFIDKDF